MQKRTWLLPVLSFLPVVFSTPTMAQVSFFQAPIYSGSGSLFAADFNGDGKPDLLSGDGTLNLGNGNGTFIAKPKIGGAPVAVADFNADGRADVLELGAGTILVLLGNGNGTFQTAITTPSGADLSNVAVADMNGDGKPDVVGIFNYNIHVYIAKGDGTFQSALSTGIGLSSTKPLLSVGDFNGDNKTDVVLSTASCCPSAGQETVFLGKGDGTFDPAKITIAAAYWESAIAAVGDFNGDGRLDLAINYWLLLGNGDGTFQPPSAVFSAADAMVAADMDGDGNLDLVLERFPIEFPGSVAIYPGRGDGTFSNPKSYMTSEDTVSGIAITDFNGDGKIDIAAGQAVLLGNGDGTLRGTPLTSTPGSVGLNGAVIGDFDNDNTQDLAILSTMYSQYNRYYDSLIFSSNGTGFLSLINSYPLQGISAYLESHDRPYAPVIKNLITADLNLDGTLDLIVLWRGDPSLGFSVLLGNGDSSFQSPVSFPLNLGTPELRNARLVVSDFNNDHRPDVAITGDKMIAVLSGNGDGSFRSPLYYFYVGSSAVVGDFNQEGNVDIAGSGILFGNGDGTFQPLVFPAGLTNFGAQYSADLNNDGKPDLISGNGVALGNGDGTFTILPDVLPESRYFLALTDLNGDGNLDAIINYTFLPSLSPYSPGCMTPICNIEVMLGNGDGTFGVETSVFNIVGSREPLQVLASDMNNDRRTDLIFTWGTIPFEYGGTSIGAVTVLFNTTPPGFEVAASSVSPSGLMPGDPGSVSVTVLADFGFSGTVTLSCAGLPTGATCSFNPASVSNGSGRSALTIATASSLAADVYNVQIQGRSGSMVRNSVVTLDLSGFAIGPYSETSQTMRPGQTASFSLELLALGSFAGSVNLTCGVKPVVTAAPVCSLSDYSVMIGNNTAQRVDVTVTTTAPVTTSVLPKVNFPGTVVPVACSFIMLGLVWFLLRRQPLPPVLVTPILALAMTMCFSCGGNGSTSLPPPHTTTGTPPGSYTVTITATSGSLSRSIPLQVVIR